MKRFRNLLVHLDLEGAHDGAAVRYASAVSRLSRSLRIEFVHTAPSAHLIPGFSEDSPAPAAQWLPQAQAAVEALVRRHFRGPPGGRVRVRVLGGAGFRDLLDQLRHGDTDLVILGKSETNVPFAEKLARKAPCSVMVVPPVRSVVYRRILVPTDFSEHSARAMEVAVAFARARQVKRLVCFNGYPIPSGHHRTGIAREQIREDTETWRQSRFEEFRQQIELEGVATELICRESPLAARGILQEARRQESDLLVMGARGMDALAAALLGSTTAQVVRESPIPTLVVKPKGAGRSLLDLVFGDSPS
ncbi:MAG TPA: universal stress protein [Verrucomicrobiota bacterium]|nr:universal stress protein [Verrucomicrobiota bacterium]HNU52215.1 universal stress protein [Verrucomicrobiota bacterium]